MNQHNPNHRSNIISESESRQVCFKFLDQTSRSFSVIIKELHSELLVPICIFYLVLRGLDTIEDDPSITVKTKQTLLREFDNIIMKDGWTYDGNRPEEKDRELLVHFHHVIKEYKALKPAYKHIIKDITKIMGNGMADFCHKVTLGHPDNAGVMTIAEYELYCYYVAGCVGEGLTRFFIEPQLCNSSLLDNPTLPRSMSLFLQKTNIIRDVSEDHEDNRRFWPHQIWSKYCSSEMILNALEHVKECLIYLAGLNEQSIFNFCVVPQCMAIATLELCFSNPALFERNVNIKISRGDACQLMLECTQGLPGLCRIVSRYARCIKAKSSPNATKMFEINKICGTIEEAAKTLIQSQEG
ncbi:squalene synthetase [Aspergillus neoniger CBS 115656]|uniref:Squalene synthetase n=1 Tax=Aspergillus neoniger (strain CBS 115656) TaxID=1448310 RepID=A0A318YMY6_ASPNB|nr:squalene synthetase [Aspergillus neoniger CBS 115656]PYH35679.1 squalene synthetase [Aspergillus neoniger CBS 115656]